jgi:hypothetical protein
VKPTSIIILVSLLAVVLLGGCVFAQTGNGHAEPVNTGGLFTDVPKDHWAYQDLEYLAQRGIITGLPGGKFNGDQPMDRYTVAAYVARAIKYMQNNPESVTPQDLDTLKQLIFQVSDSVSTLQAQIGTTQTTNLSSLEARVAKTEQSIAQINAQLQSGSGSSTDTLTKRVQANFIISLTALLVAIVGVALATLGL